ncbi:hypothetical protein VPH35_041437 [Triticum aestivum]
MCLEAQHRLVFERKYGAETFPYSIPMETAKELLEFCKSGGVWTTKRGAKHVEVLGVIQVIGGVDATPHLAGWEPCRLQVKSWEKLLNSECVPAPSSLARMIHLRGPMLGSFMAGPDYYDDGWERRVYRGWVGKKAVFHIVVCSSFRFQAGEMHIEVVDNHLNWGPVRWILKKVFLSFTLVEIEPLEVVALRKEPRASCWRRLVRKVWRERTPWWHWRRQLAKLWSGV